MGSQRVQARLSRGLAVLLDPSIRKIAIANPLHAPYGVAAVAAMRHEGIYDKVKGKLVLGENISQTAQFVQSGNADVGLLALSLAVAPAMKDNRTLRRNPGGRLSADHPGRRDSEIVAQQGTGESVPEISQAARDRGADGAIRLLDSQGCRRAARRDVRTAIDRDGLERDFPHDPARAGRSAQLC